MNRIRTALGSTVIAGALIATPVVLGLSAAHSGAQSGAQTASVVQSRKVFDDHGGKNKEREPGDGKGGKGRHHEPGDDHGHGSDG